MDVVEPAAAGIALSITALRAHPHAMRTRLIRRLVQAKFGVVLSFAHTELVVNLVENWHGQGAVHLPGIRVVRETGSLVFTAAS